MMTINNDLKTLTVPYEDLFPENSFIVGGSVRDFLLGRSFQDWDVVVPSDAIKFAFELRRKIEGSFVVVLSEEDDEARLILPEGGWMDITSFRGNDIDEDLKKRDFTINSIAVPLRLKDRLIDPTNGLDDLQNGLIRSFSIENLEDDPLRILRAFRFVSTLGFDIEDATYGWISQLAEALKQSAPERIRYELTRLFNGDHIFKAVKLMAESGVLFVLFPELKEQKSLVQKYIVEQNVFEHTLLVIKYLEELVKQVMKGEGAMGKFAHRIVPFLEHEGRRMAFFVGALLHDVAKPRTVFRDEEGRTHFHGHDRLGAEIAARRAETLRFSTEERDIVKLIVEAHMHPHLLAREHEDVTPRALNRYLRRTGELAFPLILFAVADAMATPPIGGGAEWQVYLAERLEQLIRQKEARKRKRLVTGHDIIELGLKPGPVFKRILDEIDDLEAEGVVKTRDEALAKLKEIVELVKEGKWPPPSQ